MARTPDHYAVLQVDPNAEAAVIRAAYRVLALHYHPDRPSGSIARMIALNQAWAVLGDPTARASYDRERRDKVTAAEDSEPAVVAVPVGGFRPGPLGRRERARESASTVLDFGRYAGWSVADVALCDPAYLEWLASAPAGRSHADELHRVLAQRGMASAASA